MENLYGDTETINPADDNIEVIEESSSDLLSDYMDKLNLDIENMNKSEQDEQDMKDELANEAKKLKEELDSYKKENEVSSILLDNSDPFKVTLNGRTLHFRKWKVKDKIALENIKKAEEIKDVLVFNCITEDCALDLEEYAYMLLKIRNASISEKFEFIYECENCGARQKITTDLTDIYRIRNYDMSPIVVPDKVDIQLKVVDDKSLYTEFVYDKPMDSYEQYLNDFCLHIKKFNDIEVTDRESLIEVLHQFVDLDTDVAETVLESWEKQRFKINIEANVICHSCGDKQLCDFSSIPEFFPKSWSGRS